MAPGSWMIIRATTVLVALFAALAHAQESQPTSPSVFLSTDALFRSKGEVQDQVALHEVLSDVGALPDHDEPTVILIRSVDAYWGDLRWAEDVRERELARLATIRTNTAVNDGAMPILVLAPDGTPENMEQRVSMFGYQQSAFPSTPGELVEAGLDWLADPEGFDLRWDREGLIANHVSQRWTLFGVEHVGALDMVICSDRTEVRGWARGYQDTQASDASLGRFVQRCVNHELALPADRKLAPELTAELGPDGSWFALLLPRYTYPWLEEAVALAERSLAIADPSVPLHVIATESITPEHDRIVPADEHSALLEERGVPVDIELSRRLPAWIADYTTGGASLLLFDPNGRLVESFFATNATIDGIKTLTTTLVEAGLF